MYDVGKELLNLRTQHGYTQEYIADKLGITRQAVSRWESNASLPSTANLIALTELYGVPLLEPACAARHRADMARLAKSCALCIISYAAIYGLVYFMYMAGIAGNIGALEWIDGFYAVPICCAVSLLALFAGWRHTAWLSCAAFLVGSVAASFWPDGAAGIFSGFIPLLIALAAGSAAGIALDLRRGIKCPFRYGVKQLAAALIAVLISVTFVAMCWGFDRAEFISGANAGYEAGYEAALTGGDTDGYNSPPHDFSSPAYRGWWRYWQNGWHDASKQAL